MVWWKILGVAPTSSATTIRNAYKKLAREHHPDRAHNRDRKEQAAQMFQKIANAYEESQKPGAAFVTPMATNKPYHGPRPDSSFFWNQATDLKVEITVTLGQVLKEEQVSKEYKYRKKDATMGTNRVNVRLGPHMRNKHTIRMRNKGNDPPQCRPGDLVIIITIDSGPYRICSPNIRVRVPMSLYDLLTGAKTSVVMPAGDERLCSPSVQPGDDFTELTQVFPGEGLMRKNHTMGDFIVEFAVEIPHVRPSEYPLLSAALGEKRERDDDPEPGASQKRSKHLSS